MNIVVCMKQTPSTEAKISVPAGSLDIDRSNIKYIISSYDELAVEEGIKLKEKFGGTVTVVTVGPKKADEALRSALAMGADKAIRIWDDSLESSDAFATAKLLSKAIQNNGFDIVLCGQKAIDGGSSLVGGLVAEMLDIPQVYLVTKLEAVDESTVLAHRQVEGGEEVVEAKLPALITAQRGLNTPRYPKLPMIMKAKKKPLDTLGLSDLGFSADDVAPKVQVTELTLPKEKAAGKVFSNGVDDVPQVLKLLREEAKVI